MDFDYLQISTAVAAFLAPFAPYLIEGAKGASKDWERVLEVLFWKSFDNLEKNQKALSERFSNRRCSTNVSSDPNNIAHQVLFATVIGEQLKN